LSWVDVVRVGCTFAVVITLACLDLAGTTVVDGALVEAAVHHVVDDVTERDLNYIRESMGMSWIVVFRNLLEGDEAAARAANERFERAYTESIHEVTPIAGAAEAIVALRRSGVRVCLASG
jgi:phosphoglycolate phosphatase